MLTTKQPDEHNPLLDLKHVNTTRFENNDQHTLQDFTKITGPERATHYLT